MRGASSASWRRRRSSDTSSIACDDRCLGFLIARHLAGPRRPRSAPAGRARPAGSSRSPRSRAASLDAHRRRVRSSTYSSVADTSSCGAGSPAYRRVLAASMYQSQRSFQTKRYMALTASENSYVSMSPRISSIAASSRPRIQRSTGSAHARLGLDTRRGVQQHETRGVPELVREPAALVDRSLGEAHVLGRAHLREAVAGGVGPEPVDQVERVEPGAERLAHAPSVGRLDDRVHHDVRERRRAERTRSRSSACARPTG